LKADAQSLKRPHLKEITVPKVLIVGLDPSVVDPNDPVFPPGTTPESVARGLQQALAEMQGRGWTGAFCPIMPDETAEQTVAASLRQQAWDVVVIGGGVRIPPRNLQLFERVVNAVHAGAPGAKIAFNTAPEKSADAAQRWVTSSTS
jgi:hypothetical protein